MEQNFDEVENDIFLSGSICGREFKDKKAIIKQFCQERARTSTYGQIFRILTLSSCIPSP